ncbi:hypothetical protein DS745_15955 [Anaerobacillus alkaliphilus]|uniref:Uncharacterized protein n=1 Tax=Anaerobacillus alkaliphilus TaxID=1548597 RepID=A0A4V1LFY2_9BACI|nr:hypothetical protein [Anaerobacillus alkaliphilus]RXI97854.1 hypothetical protein DS745_15955 [Anaerobacillus alkaliphilus]
MHEILLESFKSELQKTYKLKLFQDRLLAFDHQLRRYCSIQLINKSVIPIELARVYFQWLSSASKKMIKVKETQNQFELFVTFIPKPLLILTLIEADDERAIYLVSGGLLAKSNQQGTFSFLRFDHHSMIALQHFQPRLPWWLYILTQAPIHELVMTSFQKRK